MGVVIRGITLIGHSPWTDEQKAAVQSACRDVLHALRPENPPTDEEVAAYWQRRVEAPYSAVVYGQVAPHSAYWQFCGDDPEVELLHAALDQYCRPLGMTITSHMSC